MVTKLDNWTRVGNFLLGSVVFFTYGSCVDYPTWVEQSALYFFEILRRSPATRPRLGMLVVGGIGIVLAYKFLSPEGWEGLFSSLFGMAMGGD